MTETQAVIELADLDILEDVEHLIAHYPPSRKDRHAIRVVVKDGHVNLSGHVQTPNTRRYLMDNLPNIDGLRSVTADALYDDESARLDVGKVLPVGVRLGRVYYGRVVLSGKLPAGASGEDVIARVQQVPGVGRVVPAFR